MQAEDPAPDIDDLLQRSHTSRASPHRDVQINDPNVVLLPSLAQPLPPRPLAPLSHLSDAVVRTFAFLVGFYGAMSLWVSLNADSMPCMWPTASLSADSAFGDQAKGVCEHEWEVSICAIIDVFSVSFNRVDIMGDEVSSPNVMPTCTLAYLPLVAKVKQSLSGSGRRFVDHNMCTLCFNFEICITLSLFDRQPLP